MKIISKITHKKYYCMCVQVKFFEVCKERKKRRWPLVNSYPKRIMDEKK